MRGARAGLATGRAAPLRRPQARGLTRSARHGVGVGAGSRGRRCEPWVPRRVPGRGLRCRPPASMPRSAATLAACATRQPRDPPACALAGKRLSEALPVESVRAAVPQAGRLADGRGRGRASCCRRSARRVPRPAVFRVSKFGGRLGGARASAAAAPSRWAARTRAVARAGVRRLGREARAELAGRAPSGGRGGAPNLLEGASARI